MGNTALQVRQGRDLDLLGVREEVHQDSNHEPKQTGLPFPVRSLCHKKSGRIASYKELSLSSVENGVASPG